MAATPPPPPGPDVSIVGSRCLAPLIPLQTLCIVLLALRLYTRAKHLAWEDAAVAVATLAAMTQFALFLAAVPYGVGRHTYYIDPEDVSKARRLLFFSQLPLSWSLAFSKISIALLLLRFKTGRGWRVFLYAMVAVQLAIAVHSNVMVLAMCRPISASWRGSTLAGHCWSLSVVRDTIYAQGAIAACTDLIFSLIPLTFLGSVRRSVRERLVIALLMGLGVFAAAAAVIKLTLVHMYGVAGDMLWDCVDLNTWSTLEGQLGIVAACVPCLKSPFQTALRRMGLLSDVSRDWERYTADSSGLHLSGLSQTPCSRARSETPGAPDAKV